MVLNSALKTKQQQQQEKNIQIHVSVGSSSLQNLFITFNGLSTLKFAYKYWLKECVPRNQKYSNAEKYSYEFSY